MKIKCFVVIGDAKTNAALGVEKAVNAFQVDNPRASVEGVDVQADLSTRDGKAFVTVAYSGELGAAVVVPTPVAPPTETPKE